MNGIVAQPLRGILRAEGLLLLITLTIAYAQLHRSWLFFLIFLLSPDLFMLGYLRGTRVGAWSYNVAHSYVLPLGVGLVSIFVHALLPVAIIWAAHIGMDRALGYGLKYSDSFRHTHLGWIGREQSRSKEKPATRAGETCLELVSVL